MKSDMSMCGVAWLHSPAAVAMGRLPREGGHTRVVAISTLVLCCGLYNYCDVMGPT